MPVSGIAHSVFSVATRSGPCTLSPTPPPITMPSIKLTNGTSLLPIACSSE